MLDTLVAAVTPELADAVAIALALDPRERYQTAREMGRALGDGAHGIAPGERAIGARPAPATEATSVLTGSRRPAAGHERTPAASAVTPRRPRTGPPRRQPAAQPPADAPPRSSRRRGNRALLVLLGLLALAGAIVAVYLATSSSPTEVRLRNVVYSDVKQASAALEQLVSENTK